MQPPSLEEMLKRRQEQAAAEAKVGICARTSVLNQHSQAEAEMLLVLQPKFLSKKEREALALQRRQEAVSDQRTRCDLVLRASCSADHVLFGP